MVFREKKKKFFFAKFCCNPILFRKKQAPDFNATVLLIQNFNTEIGKDFFRGGNAFVGG